ncbi:MAG: Plug domain-containing protein [Flavobacteriaceae bacterium]
MKDYLCSILILFLVISMPYTIWSQQMGPNATEPLTELDFWVSLQKSNRDSLITWQEKVLLHLADAHAPNKSVIFFKGYLLTGPKNLRVSMSKVLKVELLDQKGEVILKQYHPINEGMIMGNLEVPKKLPSGQYFLRAYTRWMQNYGESSYAVKPVFIGKTKSQPAINNNATPLIDIYPEGGNLLNGLLNRVVVKIDQRGSNANALKGQITDEQGKVVSILTAYPTDFFAATFEPQSGKAYTLKMSDGSSYPMPVAKDKGCLLQINNLDREMVRVRILATSAYQGAQLKLLAEFEGIPYLERYLNINQQGKVEFEMPKKGFRRGIVWLRLIDDEGLELSARPIWIDDGGVKVAVTPINKGKQQAGETVLEVKVTDMEDNPVETEVALSITKNLEALPIPDVASADFDEFDLFPSTEGIGNSTSLDRARQLRFIDDLRLLCSAAEIRRYIDGAGQEGGDIRFPFQNGLELIGYAYDMENNLLRNTPIQVMAFSETDVWAQDLESDSNGRLVLENLQLRGMTELVFRTTGDESQERMVKVIPAKSTKQSESATREKTLASQEKKRIYEPTDQTPSDTTGLIELQEVVVREKANDKSQSPSLFNVQPTRIKYQNPERPQTIPELLMNIPNIRVIGIGSQNPVAVNIRSEMAGGGPLLYVLDGFPLSQGQGRGSLGSIGNNPLVEIMNLVPASDVERIEFLLGPEAAIFGSRSNGGVLLFYTRTGAELRKSERKEAQLMFQGYELPVDFVEYKETESKRVRELSSTLYWNPTVNTGTDGKAIIKLSIPNNNESVIIQASTVTKEGHIGKFSAALDR